MPRVGRTSVVIPYTNTA